VGEGGFGWQALDDVAVRMAALGLEEGEKGIAFCNTGHHASVVWFVAHELMGRDFALYDGSIYDWTQVRLGPTVIGANPEAK
jgi:thiosulfate/3-mercaptopyruvate sulfurtransferase